MRNHSRLLICALLTVLTTFTSAVCTGQALAGSPASPNYPPNVPAKITTPDIVETRIGTLRFKDGAPDAETVKLAYDQLDCSPDSSASLTR